MYVSIGTTGHHVLNFTIFTDHSEALVTCEKIIAEAMEGAMHAFHHLGPTSVRHQQSDEGK